MDIPSMVCCYSVAENDAANNCCGGRRTAARHIPRRFGICRRLLGMVAHGYHRIVTIVLHFSVVSVDRLSDDTASKSLAFRQKLNAEFGLLGNYTARWNSSSR